MTTWVYKADGRVILKGAEAPQGGPMFIPDEPDFISPIDKKLYSGRAGMREHNKRHDVVSNRDLVGLPTLTTHQEVKPDHAAIRGEIIKAARKLGHM